MIVLRLTGLSLLALALGGTIAFEFADRNAKTVDEFPRRNVVPTAHPPAPASLSQSDIESRLSEVLARPIFSPDRRPAALATANVAGLSRLTGVVVTGSHKVAIFAPASGDHPVVVEEGGRINAYEVRQISVSGVTVVGPSGTTTVTPAFNPAQPSEPKRGMPVLPKPGGARKQ